jgi:hypothetical protein
MLVSHPVWFRTGKRAASRAYTRKGRLGARLSRYQGLRQSSSPLATNSRPSVAITLGLPTKLVGSLYQAHRIGYGAIPGRKALRVKPMILCRLSEADGRSCRCRYQGLRQSSSPLATNSRHFVAITFGLLTKLVGPLYQAFRIGYGAFPESGVATKRTGPDPSSPLSSQ